jgi:hypothetical protein
MIKITDKLYIDGEKYQYIVKQKTVAKSGKNKGETRWVELTYHSKLDDALMSVMDFMTKKQIAEKEMTLSKAIRAIKETREHITTLVKENTDV